MPEPIMLPADHQRAVEGLRAVEAALSRIQVHVAPHRTTRLLDIHLQALQQMYRDVVHDARRLIIEAADAEAAAGPMVVTGDVDDPSTWVPVPGQRGRPANGVLILPPTAPGLTG